MSAATLRRDTLPPTFSAPAFTSPAAPDTRAVAGPVTVGGRPATPGKPGAQPLKPLDFSLELPATAVAGTTAAERLVANAVAAAATHPVNVLALTSESIPLASLATIVAQRDAAQAALGVAQKDLATLREAIDRRDAVLRMLQQRMRSALDLLAGARDHWHAQMAAADLEAARRLLAETLPGTPIEPSERRRG